MTWTTTTTSKDCNDGQTTDNRDGIVEGTAGNDLINYYYTGDPDGDKIDHEDAILSGQAKNDDIVYAGRGNDTVASGEGNDKVYAGSGNDVVYGGNGNDTIYGDSDPSEAAGRESFNWSQVSDSCISYKGDTVDNYEDMSGRTIVQDTGDNKVTVEIPDSCRYFWTSKGVDSSFTTNGNNVDGLNGGTETVSSHSGLQSYAEKGESATYKFGFETPAEHVQFNISDIDANKGQVTIRAYDASGKLITVSLTGGSNLALTDTDSLAGVDTATSKYTCAVSPTAASNTLHVEIAGPVARIEVIHTNVGYGDSAVVISDMFFDTAAPVPGDDYLDGGDGDDVIYGEAGNDTLLGGKGNDTLDGGSGNNLLKGGEGNDKIVAGDGANTVSGGAGDDKVVVGNGANSIDGGTGNDTILAGNGNNTITGGDGSDRIITGDGNNKIVSGDTGRPDQGYEPYFSGDTDPNNDRDYVQTGAGNDTIFTGDDDDTIYAGDGNNYVDAGFDDDLVVTGKGNDTIIGGEGNDTIWSGAGDDLIYGGMGPDTDLVNIPDADGDKLTNNARDEIHAGAGNDTVFGQDDNDLIYGGDGHDYLDGGVDDDTLYGDAGNDTLKGGQGNDSLIGGAGADKMYGGDDKDIFVIGKGEGAGDFVDGGAGGIDFDTLDLTNSAPEGGSFVVHKTSVDSNGNGWNGYVDFFDKDGNAAGKLDFEEIEKIVPCFTPGTAIATPKGERLVEELQVGDKVITRDNGIREIAWLGKKTLDYGQLSGAAHLRPVLIRAGSLGNGLPERDMLVSPNHRMLVANDRTALYFDEHEVLVSAKHLVNGSGVSRVEALGVTYIHFMFDQHEVVLANGAWTESFQPGDHSLAGIGNAQRSEIFELFPELQTAQGIKSYTAARKTLKRHEAALLTF
ncbi:Hint domain-containing protein [Frigidibacter sp. MR17.24]|uniref:Hint domain-containing protein n=1 Tax=Frigidibacter sp. MR17.24 TaxID=3127345 RepID=UPI0030131A68